jgi:phenylalanyl-tRNA synthetase beta chain
MDAALLVAHEHPEAAVRGALAAGAGELLEELRLFDLYTGPPVPEGQRSLAYAFTFRAPDRTLTGEEASAALHAAVAAAADATGAVLRG